MITIYGRSNPPCPFCKAAEARAKRSGEQYEYFDLSKGEWDKESLEAKLNHTIRTVPVVVVDGKFIGGDENLYHYLKTLPNNKN